MVGAGRQQINIIEHPVVPVIFDLLQTRALGLDPHINVFGDETDKRAGVVGL